MKHVIAQPNCSTSSATMTVRPAAGPLTCNGEPPIKPATRPPTIAAIKPASTGASDAIAIPSDNGSATRNTTNDAGRSWRIASRNRPIGDGAPPSRRCSTRACLFYAFESRWAANHGQPDKPGAYRMQMFPATPRRRRRRLFQDEDGDLSSRLLLVFGVRGKGFHSPLPPLLSLGPIELACSQLQNLVAILQRHRRVGLQVEEPGRVFGRPAVRRDDEIAALVFYAHQGHVALFAGLRTGHGQQDNRPVEDLHPVGRALVQNFFGLLAHPVSGAQFDVVSHSHI